MSERRSDFFVGIFVILAGIGLLMLAYRVSNFADSQIGNTYTIKAGFDNIGGLKVRAPVSIGGVKIGEVTKIGLEVDTYRALVYMQISDKYNKLAHDSNLRILTAGLLGSNYLSIEPGFNDDGLGYLKDGSEITEVHSAIILENLIGQFLFSLNSKEDD